MGSGTGRAVTLRPAFPSLAFDRSVRTYDRDGRLHVEVALLTRAEVSAYYASEIPNWQSLGLEPNRFYQMLRDPAELARAVASFNNQPILSVHWLHSTAAHDPEIVVGSTGTDAAFNDPDLTCSLVIWDPVAIAGIQTSEQRDLSCGYHYVPDMRGGSYRGVRFDGRMTSIAVNHIAVVDSGRVLGAMVGDARPDFPTITGDTPMQDETAEKLMAFLKDRLTPEDFQRAQDIVPASEGDPAAGMAADRMRQRSAQAKLAEMQADETRRRKMFPHYDRLMRGV